MRTRRSILALIATACLLGIGLQPARAYVNVSVSTALDAAAPYIKKGFSVRADNWTGKLSVGQKKAIKHQLFKGNEYWFWLGTTNPDVKLSVKVYDKKGRPVDVETKPGKKTASARVLAPKTGTYYIVIKAVAAEPEKKKEFEPDAVSWGLVYGYR